MAQPHHTISIHPQAPAKPAVGAPCNGCGVCCLFEPCPLGILLSRSRSGVCAALRWENGRYRCGALVAPHAILQTSLPRGSRWLTNLLAPALRRLGGRWIAAGIGCDSELEVALKADSTTIMRSPERRACVRHPHHD